MIVPLKDLPANCDGKRPHVAVNVTAKAGASIHGRHFEGDMASTVIVHLGDDALKVAKRMKNFAHDFLLCVKQ